MSGNFSITQGEMKDIDKGNGNSLLYSLYAELFHAEKQSPQDAAEIRSKIQIVEALVKGAYENAIGANTDVSLFDKKLATARRNNATPEELEALFKERHEEERQNLLRQEREAASTQMQDLEKNPSNVLSTNNLSHQLLTPANSRSRDTN